MSAATRTGPVRWDEGYGAFVVTGFDEASSVLRGQGWSSDPANSPLTPAGMTDLPTGLMLFRDPPDHTRLRRLVAPAFAARAVETLRPRVAAIVESCLDGLDDTDAVGSSVPAGSSGPAGSSDAAGSSGTAGSSGSADSPGTAASSGTADLLADFGYLVPLAVIAELLDVGVEGAQVFLEQTPRLVRMLEVDATADDLAESVEAALEVTLFLTPILSSRQGVGGGEDFISALLATDGLSLDEVLATCILLLAAGHETTANLIGTGSLALLRHPDQIPVLLADPARGVEELLRLHGPVKLIARTALVDQVLGDVVVPAGRQVLLRMDEANRDPRRWDDPDRLDLSRPGPAHLGFGTGIHFCLGAALARMEAAEALVRLLRRYPRTALAGEVRWRASSTFHAVQSVPVRFG